METQDIPKELGLFYVDFLTVQLYIHLDQFIIFQFTLPTLYHQAPSSFILVLKMLHLNLLNTVALLTLKVVLGYHPTRIATILTIFKPKVSISILTDTRILLSQLSVDLNKNSLSTYSSTFWSCLYHSTKTNGKKSTHGRSPRKYP